MSRERRWERERERNHTTKNSNENSTQETGSSGEDVCKRAHRLQYRSYDLVKRRNEESRTERSIVINMTIQSGLDMDHSLSYFGRRGDFFLSWIHEYRFR